MLTVLEIIKKTTDFFATRGIENPRLNAELLVGHGLGLARMQLYLQFERPLAEAELEKIRPLVRRRGQREPLQYIVGETEFAGLKLKTDRRALIPRPETELLVEWLTVPDERPAPRSVLDLGTGTGAIALALARHFPAAAVTAVDLSDEALALAAENAERTALTGRVRWLKSDWFSALPNETFDLIVGNPPYLSTAETAAAEPEVRDHEPVSALTSGEDGMNALRTILADAPKHLAPTGLLALETGIAHHETLREIAARAGFSRTESRQDLTKRDRFFFAYR
jgi:release factor glutamine methyltransferase